MKKIGNTLRATAGLNFREYFNNSKSDGADLLISKLFALLLHKEGFLEAYTNNFSTHLEVTVGHRYFDIYQEIKTAGIFIDLEDVKFLRTIDYTILAQDFPETFDMILVENYSRLRGFSMMPLQVELFVKSIFKNPVERVYVPDMHSADFCNMGDRDLKYYGNNIFAKEIILSKLRLYAYEKYDFTFCETALQPNSFDAICSFPSINPKEPLRFSFFQDNINLLRMEGKMVVIMPFNFLFDRRYKEVRKELIKHGFLESIIELPAGIFNRTGIKTTLLVMSNFRDSSKIRYYDSSQFFDKAGLGRFLDWQKLTSLYLGQEAHYEIDIKDYTFDDNFDLFLPRVLSTFPGTPLRDLMSSIGTWNSSDSISGRIANLDSFKKNSDKFEISALDMEKGVVKNSMKKIAESALLITTQGGKILSNFYLHDNEEIHLTGFTQAFKVHENVDYRYLILALKSQNVSKQIELLGKATLTAMPVRNILGIKIEIPSIEEQKIIVDNYLLEISKTEYLQESYSKAMADFNTLRHKVAGQANGLPHVTSKITQIISEKVEPLYPDVLNLKLEKSKYTLREYLQFMKNDSENLKTLLTTQISKVIDFDALERKPLEVISFLRNFCYLANEKSSYDVKFEISDDLEQNQYSEIFIYGDAEALRQMFENLLDNAEKHAFKGISKNRVEIFIDAYMDSKEVVILVSNTGSPFPVNFTFADFIKKGISAGAQHGSGIGGWLINQIVEKHDGRLDYIDEQGSEGIGGDLTSSFEITFPLTENMTDESI